MTNKLNSKWVYGILLGLMIIGGASLRLSNLGKYSFWTDEFFAVYAAKSHMQDGSFYVPYEGEHPYRKIVTYLTEFMFEKFGESEANARLPFAIANLLLILIIFIYFSKYFNKNIALFICCFVAFSPLFINMSRECRSYTLHQLMYFITAVTFYRGFESDGNRSIIRLPKIIEDIQSRYKVDFIYLIMSGIIGYIAKNLQPLTYNLAFVLVGYALTKLCVNYAKKNNNLYINLKYISILVLFILGVAFQYVFNNEHFLKMVHWAIALPEWARNNAYSIHYYRWLLSDEYPAFFYFYPLGMYLTIRIYKSRGLYFIYMFIIPFLLHSFVYKLKADRYIFYVLPYFALGLSVVLDSTINQFRGNFQRQYKYEQVVVVLLLLPIVLFVAQPWYRDALSIPFNNKFPDWHTFDSELKAKLRNATVITTRPMEYLYYIKKKPDYSIENEIPPNYDYGADLIDSTEKFKSVLSKYSGLYLVAYRSHLTNKSFFSPGMTKLLNEYMIEQTRDSYGKPFIVLKKRES